MTDGPLGIALVGCGLVGNKRARQIGGTGALLVACDTDAARAAEVAADHQRCQSTTDYRKAVTTPGVQIVIVATPNAFLAPVAQAAISAGKHVLIEKPCATSSADIESLLQSARKSTTLVRAAYNHRFHPAIRQAHEMYVRGVIGPVMFVRARYGHGGRIGYENEWRANRELSGGGELIDQGTHLIDLARWFMGDFESVDGHAATYFWKMPVDDNAFLSLRTAKGNTAWLQVSCTEWKNMFSMEIYGRTGKLEIQGLGGSYGPERLIHYEMLPEMGPPKTHIFDFPDPDNSWKLELAAFIEDIRLGRPSVPGLNDALEVMKIVEKIYASNHSIERYP